MDRASITADLEALKAQGMAGVTVYNLSGPGVTTKGPDYMSPEWRELFLNGKSLGSRDFKHNKSLHLEWQVPYAAGVLRCCASRQRTLSYRCESGSNSYLVTKS